MHYSKETPYLAPIKERYRLGSCADKHTWHVVLDLKGSDITYAPGDCVGIIPVNAPEVVERTLEAMQATGEELIVDRNTPDPLRLREFLTRKANVTQLNRKLLRAVAAKEKQEGRKQALVELIANRDACTQYLEQNELWDLLEAHPTARFEPQELCALLGPLLPRFYSIASSQSNVGHEVHLTVRHLTYTAKEIRRLGVCTHYLCHLVPLGQPVVPLFVQPAGTFKLPEDHSTDLIMIGPGTGVAPFRAFMQERIEHNASGRHWLFFGEWTKTNHFYYAPFWERLVKEGHLRLHTAFSRDQADKVYVQHRIAECADDLWQWLEQGAHLYVCGDAKQMAKDVNAALHNLIQQQGKVSSQAASDYLRTLRKAKRYLTDVY